MGEKQTVMDNYEFELRYKAYLGMSIRFGFQRDDDLIVKLIRKTSKGTLEKKLQETSPADLKNFTFQTYTPFKLAFIESAQNIFPGTDQRFSLSDYINRLEYELKVIREMGYNSYFLIVSDYVKRAKDNKIGVGPGRGSGAGSVLAWFIEITNIDPMPFDLIFERFLNPARVSMPDFDIDFEDTKRQDVIEYCSKKYGSEKVCAIGTFMKMKGKVAFKDTARTLGVAFEKSNIVSNLIEDKKTGLQMIQDPECPEELKTLYENDEYVKNAINYGHNLTDNIRQIGVHACGIIIAPEKVTTYTPTQYNKEDDHTVVSQYDGPTLEQIGLLKMDFLGLRNLSIIKNCIKIIKARKDKNGEPLPEMFQHYLDTMNFIPPLDDNETYEEIFKQGETTGIFQFESTGMKKYLIQLEPNTFDNLIAMVALYRPGPLEFIPSYIERKNGREKVEYLYQDLKEELIKKYGEECAKNEREKLIEDLNPIMGDTYGIAIYQEQLMFLVQAMAGFSLGEADLLRRAIGKKKKYIIEKLKGEFIERCGTFRGYKEETATQIYEKMIEPAASYSFNKSHAVCYAFVSYQTAYLKAHYPIEFYAALIRSEEENTDKQSVYIEEIQQHGMNVFAPDVNESFNHVAAIDDYIRLGFSSIKGVGQEVGEMIQQERIKNGNYTSFEDFCKRCEKIINKKSLESLIKSGAFDSLQDRKILLENIEIILEWIKSAANADQGLFGGLATSIPFKKNEKSTLMERLLMEQEVFECFLSGNPLDGLYLYIKKNSLFYSQINEKFQGDFTVIGYIKDFFRTKFKTNKPGMFVKCSDISGDFEFFLPDNYGLKKFDLLIIHGYKKERITITKIIKTDHERLKELAGGSYDPEWTAIKAKKLRYGDQKKEDIEKIKQKAEQEKEKSETSGKEENSIQGITTQQDFSQEILDEESENFEDLKEEITEIQEESMEETTEEATEETREETREEPEKINEENLQEKEDQHEDNSENNSNNTNDTEKFQIEIKDLSNMTIFQLSGIIKNNPGNIPIILKGVKGENTEKEMLVTPEALERIKDLLNHS